MFATKTFKSGIRFVFGALACFSDFLVSVFWRFCRFLVSGFRFLLCSMCLTVSGFRFLRGLICCLVVVVVVVV